MKPIYRCCCSSGRSKKRLSNLIYGNDDYIFVYDGNGICLVSPIITDVIGKNLIGRKDSNNVYFIKDLIEAGKAGGGFVKYVWPKKSKNNQEVPKLSYAIYLEKWNWMVGTGIYIDDLDTYINAAKDKQSIELKKNNLRNSYNFYYCDCYSIFHFKLYF